MCENCVLILNHKTSSDMTCDLTMVAAITESRLLPRQDLKRRYLEISRALPLSYMICIFNDWFQVACWLAFVAGSASATIFKPAWHAYESESICLRQLLDLPMRHSAHGHLYLYLYLHGTRAFESLVSVHVRGFASSVYVCACAYTMQSLRGFFVLFWVGLRMCRWIPHSSEDR